MQRLAAQKFLLLTGVSLSVLTLFLAFGLLHIDDADDQIYFKLTSHQNQSLTEMDIQGHFALVFFGFTHCPDVCPTQMSFIRQLMHSLDQRTPGHSVKPLFITVDPKVDTPEVLASYVSFFDARIVGLTGSEAAIARAALAFNAVAPFAAQQDKSQHSAIIYVVAPDGRIVDFISTSTPIGKAADTLNARLNAWI